MKTLIILSLFIITHSVDAQSKDKFYKIHGKIKSENEKCSKPTQLFVSQKRTLLYQIEVPVNGTFSLNLKKGEYFLKAANEQKCETDLMKLVTDKNNEQITLNLKENSKKEKKI